MPKRAWLALLLAVLGPSAPRALAPGPPQSLAAHVSGNTVTLSWLVPSIGVPSHYLVEAALSPGGLPVSSLAAARSPVVVPNVPNGVYYVRVRAVDASGVSGASNEVIVVVPSGGACTFAPNPPRNLTGMANGNLVNLFWSAPIGECSPTSYVVHAGTAPASSNITVANVGLATSLSAAAPGGTYYVRVVAVNVYGASPASNEIVVVVGSGGGSGISATAGGVVVRNSRPVGVYRYPIAPDIVWILYEGEAVGLAPNQYGVTLFCRQQLPAGANATCTGVPQGSNTIFVGIRQGFSGAESATNDAYDPDQGCSLTSGIVRRATSIRHHEWGHVFQIVSGRNFRPEEQAQCFGAEVTRWAVNGLAYSAIIPALNHLWEAFDSNATVTYQYTGNRFTHFSCGPPAPNGNRPLCPNPAPGQSSYTTSDFISITLSVPRRLQPNLRLANLQVETGIKYTLTATDGHQVLSLIDDRASPLLVSTDADGNIVAPWWIGVIDRATQRGAILTINSQPHNQVSDSANLGAGNSAVVFNAPGRWTTR